MYKCQYDTYDMYRFERMHGFAETNCQNVTIETRLVIINVVFGNLAPMCCKLYVRLLMIHFIVSVTILVTAKWRQQSCIHPERSGTKKQCFGLGFVFGSQIGQT